MISYEIQLRFVIQDKIWSQTNSVQEKIWEKDFFVKKKKFVSDVVSDFQ